MASLIHRQYTNPHASIITLLIIYITLALSNALQLSITFDETPHLTAGISYWQTNDYRLHPENGVLPQRWAALPSYLNTSFQFQNLIGWTHSDVWMISQQTLFNPQVNLNQLVLLGRCMVILFGCLLGLLIYQWSKQLYGQFAALLSLSIYCVSPTILAHSSLITSDFIFTFFLLLSTACLWHLLHHLTWKSLLCCGLAIGALFLSKLSAVLFIPNALLIIILRLIINKPWYVALHKPTHITHIKQQFSYLSLVLFSIGLIAWLTIWAGYGFRYSISANLTAPAQLYDHWSQTGLLGIIINFFRHYQLLPEAYLYGISFVSQHIERISFLNGQYSFMGWWYYFPYTFIIKTPLPILGFISLSMLATGYYCRKIKNLLNHIYKIIPLLSLLIVYLLFSLNTSLNIGHRHILPIYPILFILCGSIIFLIKHKIIKIIIIALSLWLLLESIYISPNHLSYFNQIIGGPKQGYKHLLDSSVDWGQNLPQLKKWLDKNQLNKVDKPIYLAYFGSAPVTRYQINIKLLPSYIDPSQYQKYHQPIQELTAGTYIISANILQSLYTMIGELGPWTQHYENLYQQFKQRKWTAKNQWDQDYFIFRNLRLARLCAYLRQRKPDAYIGYSLLVYQLNHQQIQQALLAPPAELFMTDQVIRPQVSIQTH